MFNIFRRKLKTPSLPPSAFDLSNSELVWKAQDAVGTVLNKAGGKYQSKVHMLVPQWRFVYVMLKLDAEVCNGGFHQFFTNAQGIFDSHLEEDILLLEHVHGQYKEILNRVFTLYQGIDYQDQWDNLGKSWDFFVAPYKEGRFKEENDDYLKTEPGLDEVVGKYIRSHREDYQ